MIECIYLRLNRTIDQIYCTCYTVFTHTFYIGRHRVLLYLLVTLAAIVCPLAEEDIPSILYPETGAFGED